MKTIQIVDAHFAHSDLIVIDKTIINELAQHLIPERQSSAVPE